MQGMGIGEPVHTLSSWLPIPTVIDFLPPCSPKLKGAMPSSPLPQKLQPPMLPPVLQATELANKKKEQNFTCYVAAQVLRSLAVGVLQIDIRIVKINTATYQLVHLKPNLIAQVW